MYYKSLILPVLWALILTTTGAHAATIDSGTVPSGVLDDTSLNETDWGLSVDAFVNEGFEITWTDSDPSETATPFVIERGAPANTLYLDALGQIGVGTNTPGVDLHIQDPDADGVATLRLEETDGTSGIWEIMGQFGAFQIRDGVGDNSPLRIVTGAPAHSLDIQGNGNIGLGTSFATEAVDVMRDGAARFQLSSFSSTASDAAQYIQRRSRGTEAAPTAVQSGDNIGLFSFRGMRPNGLFSGSKAAITVQAMQNWGNAANGTRMVFSTTAIGTPTLAATMILAPNHNVLVPNGDVIVQGTTLNVPDYVFADDYDLMPLDELEGYIQEHKHLPRVASADEVKREGVGLGGSQMALLEKVEELTLYTLQQQAELRGIKDEMAELKRLLAER